jgi:hypothetical protein
MMMVSFCFLLKMFLNYDTQADLDCSLTNYLFIHVYLYKAK